MRIDDFTYPLPENRIAKYPLDQRDASKLLIYDRGKISHKPFRELPNALEEPGWLIFNDTRVIHARLLFRKPTGAKIEIFCLEPVAPQDYAQNFAATQQVSWNCMVGNLKKWKTETLQTTIEAAGKTITLTAHKAGATHDGLKIAFRWDAPGVSFGELIAAGGKIPIPPYLKRDSETLDQKRYQTIYSQVDGSVAAPTAGLHFTPAILQKLKDKGHTPRRVTLHVGAGTFKPVQEQDYHAHEMHAETFRVEKTLLEALAATKQAVTAVGTTSVRTLESIYWLGVRQNMQPSNTDFYLPQWAYKTMPQDVPLNAALKALIDYLQRNGLDALQGSTQIMITPGYRFRVVQRMITNFHQPRSTLLLLIAAFIGDDWKRAYQYALENNFRFLSYGDSSLLIPKTGT